MCGRSKEELWSLFTTQRLFIIGIHCSDAGPSCVKLKNRHIVFSSPLLFVSSPQFNNTLTQSLIQVQGLCFVIGLLFFSVVLNVFLIIATKKKQKRGKQLSMPKYVSVSVIHGRKWLSAQKDTTEAAVQWFSGSDGYSTDDVYNAVTSHDLVFK